MSMWGLAFWILIAFAIVSILGQVLGFMPFLIASMIFMSPLLGTCRKLNKIKIEPKTILNKTKNWFSVYKYSIPMIIIAFVVMFSLFQSIVGVIVTSVFYSIIACVLSVILWESARIIFRMVGKIDLHSYVDAIKSIF